MWYHFDLQGICRYTSDGPIASVEGITSIYWDEIHYDIQYVFLEDGHIVYRKTEDNNDV